MSAPLPIPDTYRTLVSCLRLAFHDAPADGCLRRADWPGLLRQAHEHGVAAYLYPWLAKSLPDVFSSRASEEDGAAPAVWRTLFLNALSHSVLRQKQLTDLFGEFARSRRDIVPFKGAWLCEKIYDDPAQRTMSDLDLLVRQEDRDACHALFLSCGYSARRVTLHNAFSRDQSYSHHAYPWAVEMHWDFVSKMADVAPPPDLAAIWQNTAEAVWRGEPIRELSLEDCVCQLAHHLLGHLFALPLRAHLDLALLVKKSGSLLSPGRLDAAAARWRTGACVPFLLRFTSALFEFPLPAALSAYAAEADPSRLGQACQALFNLPQARARDGELTLLRFKRASAPARLRLVLSRIFMPQEFLLLHYPCARHTCGLPLAWLLRARDLCRTNSAKLLSLSKGVSNEQPVPAGAEAREELVRWLMSEKQ